jgi:hypothetical protein
MGPLKPDFSGESMQGELKIIPVEEYIKGLSEANTEPEKPKRDDGLKVIPISEVMGSVFTENLPLHSDKEARVQGQVLGKN